MARRYTRDEDDFIVMFFEGVGAEMLASHDLARSAASITVRAKFLKDSGTWRHIELAHAHSTMAEILAGRIPKSAPALDDMADFDWAVPFTTLERDKT